MELIQYQEWCVHVAWSITVWAIPKVISLIIHVRVVVMQRMKLVAQNDGLVLHFSHSLYHVYGVIRHLRHAIWLAFSVVFVVGSISHRYDNQLKSTNTIIPTILIITTTTIWTRWESIKNRSNKLAFIFHNKTRLTYSHFRISMIIAISIIRHSIIINICSHQLSHSQDSIIATFSKRWSVLGALKQMQKRNYYK